MTITCAEFVAIVQTLGIILVASVLIYAVSKVGRAIEGVVKGLREPLLLVVKDNDRLNRELSAAWKRIEALEDRVRGDGAG
jgi:hypothetical protein